MQKNSTSRLKATCLYLSLILLVLVTSSMSIRILYVTCDGSFGEEELGSIKTTPAQNCRSSSSSKARSISWPSVRNPSSLFREKHWWQTHKKIWFVTATTIYFSWTEDFEEEKYLCDLCKSCDGVADVIVDVQPGYLSSGVPWSVRRGRGQEACNTGGGPGRVLQAQVDQHRHFRPPQQILSHTRRHKCFFCYQMTTIMHSSTAVGESWPAAAESPRCSPCRSWSAAPPPSSFRSAPEGSAGPRRSCSPSEENKTCIGWRVVTPPDAGNALVFYSTSFITCRTAGVSGVYNSLPIKSGFIPRHTMRDRGLDSRPRIKLLQNGAAEKKGQI